MRWLTYLYLALSPFGAWAQAIDHTTCKVIMMQRAEQPLDSLTVIPESITFRNSNQIFYHYNPNAGTIYFDAGQVLDTVEVCYQTIPYQLHKKYQHKQPEDYATEQRNTAANPTQNKSMLTKKEELFPTENLQKSGSLSRGISFGNAQNVVVNSSLNLQLDGQLGDDLNIRASITDQNVPFQPEGNTAQIQDFDNIYLELYNDKFSLKGGDIVFKNNESTFLKYYKNVQGGMLTTNYKIGRKSMASTSLGFSQAKGKFASLQLEVEEGVSGPYRIEVPNTSKFIIILANSEKVYLDGQRLQRGFNFDYVIDYNRAEIQFTSKVLITKFSRVRIDVEYSDQNYSRRIITASHSQQTGKAHFNFNYYSEKDNPNKPLTVQLDEEDKLLMQTIGDSLDRAVKISAQQVPHNQDEILYRKADTLDISGNASVIFIYATSPEDTLYRVSFSEVGMGKGDYILTNSTTNGRIYQWVSPINGVPQGSFAPLVKIPAPNQKDMMTLGGEVQLSKYEKISAEAAFSHNDLNLFSELDSHDDQGFALKGSITSANRPISFMKHYLLSAHTSYEFDNAYFSAIDRFRYIEFDRDWSYDATQAKDQNEDHILEAAVIIKKDELNKLGYKIVRRKRAGQVDGTQQYFDWSQRLGRLQLLSDAFLMNNRTVQFDASWKRLNAEAYLTSRYLRPGYKFTLDENALRSPGTDSIVSTAMNYREHLFYLENNDTLKTKFGFSYSMREDRAPEQGVLVRGDVSNTAKFYVNTRYGAGQRLDFLFTYRKNKNYQVSGTPQDEETLIARTDWYATFFHRHIRSDLTYVIGNGRELRREYIYVQVPTGEGTHTWRDDNRDGKQDLSEFYLAVLPDEKNYIKVIVPTSDFVFAYENTFNYRLNLEMPRAWREEGGIKQLLSRLSSVSSWNITKRITNTDLKARILPFYNKIPVEDVLSLRETVRSRIFYNRANPGLGFDAGYVRTSNKQLLSQGFEEKSREDYSANVRWNLNRFYNLKILYLQGQSMSNSDFLQGRKFEIEKFRWVPEFSWQPNPGFRVSVLYGFTNKTDRQQEPSIRALTQEVTGDIKMSKAADMALEAFFKYSYIDFNGMVNTPVAYEMLEALQPGRNYSWNIMFQKKILNGLQLTATYEGRKSGESQVVHIGRMQVSALF